MSDQIRDETNLEENKAEFNGNVRTENNRIFREGRCGIMEKRVD